MKPACFIPRGAGPTAAVERREASVPVRADCASLSAWNARRPLAPAGLRHWPADGCRCTRAPVGALLPRIGEAEQRKTRRSHASRERRRLRFCVLGG